MSVDSWQPVRYRLPQTPITSTPKYNVNRIESSTKPSWDNSTFFLMVLAILVPIVFTIILCIVTYCVYRYNRKLSSRRPTNTAYAPNNRNNAHIATIIYNTQHSPFIYEESPPSYDSLGDTKKNPSSTIINVNEQFPLTILPDVTLTNPDETTTTTTAAAAAAAAVIVPSAPTPPPPSYSQIEESNRS